VTAYDSLGNAVELGITAVFESKANAGNLWRFYVESADATVGNRAVATGTLLFDGQGQLMSTTGTDITIPRDNTGAITPLAIELDFKQTNGFSDQKSEWSKLDVNGSAIGTLTSFSIGANGSLGAGKIQSGALELSNVDLSEEFVNLIIASTGFSASSRVISMSDRLIQELLNTSR
jgi:flagellar hook protein FlgE